MERFLSPLTEERRAGLAERQLPGPAKEPEGKAYRTEAQRDRDRILYTSALQRLAYVTQVTAPEAGHTFHNRLSHSLKVAQVGRRNTERLQVRVAQEKITGAAAEAVRHLDPDSVEASCLAHDLGHPPFGHIAERVLQQVASETLGEEFDSFEGNAQSFRIVTRLAVRADQPGLNLTRQTLDGLLKYPRGYSGDQQSKAHSKWGYYDDDDEAFEFARAHSPKSEDEAERSLQAEIMDWADDVTYAVHDVDDFFRAGLIPIHELQKPGSEDSQALRQLLVEAREAEPEAFPGIEIDDLVEAAARPLGLYGPGVPYQHRASDRASMREFGSRLITRYLEAFAVEDEPDGDRIRISIDEDRRCEVEALKLLVRVYVIRRPGLAVVQHGQRRMVADLFKWYYAASEAGEAGERRLFPAGTKERLERAHNTPRDRGRIVIDFISSLTESSAAKLHERLGGGGTPPALDATAQIG